MQPQEFKLPATQEEFEKRAADYTAEGAEGVLKSLRKRRERAVKPFDDEIVFLKKVIKHKGGEV